MNQRNRNTTKGIIIATVLGWAVVAVGALGLVKLDNSFKAKKVAENQLIVNVSRKGSDAEWLYRLGEISDEEWDNLTNYSAQSPTLRELDEYLNALLENRKEEYFIKRVAQ